MNGRITPPIPHYCEEFWEQQGVKYCRASRCYKKYAFPPKILAPIPIECPFASSSFETFRDIEEAKDYAVTECSFSGSVRDLVEKVSHQAEE
ncbi:MAG: hypothetical protein ABH840_00610 [Nanoarchaeota archaeon]